MMVKKKMQRAKCLSRFVTDTVTSQFKLKVGQKHACVHIPNCTYPLSLSPVPYTILALRLEGAYVADQCHKNDG